MEILANLSDRPLDTKPIQGALLAYSPRLREEARRAIRALYDRLNPTFVCACPRTRWTAIESEGRFAIHFEVCVDAFVIYDIKVDNAPVGAGLGGFVVERAGQTYRFLTPRRHDGRAFTLDHPLPADLDNVAIPIDAWIACVPSATGARNATRVVTVGAAAARRDDARSGDAVRDALIDAADREPATPPETDVRRDETRADIHAAAD